MNRGGEPAKVGPRIAQVDSAPHNCLTYARRVSSKQDADLVVLINRPDGYDRDSPRSGEADLLLAKHRNGPTKTCTVASTLHMASFRDLAPGY